MGRLCSICSRDDASAIEAAILGGLSLRDAAKRFGIAKNNLNRHMREHRDRHGAAMAKANRRRGSSVADEVDDTLETLRKDYQAARKEGRGERAMDFLKEIRYWLALKHSITEPHPGEGGHVEGIRIIITDQGEDEAEKTQESPHADQKPIPSNGHPIPCPEPAPEPTKEPNWIQRAMLKAENARRVKELLDLEEEEDARDAR